MILRQLPRTTKQLAVFQLALVLVLDRHLALAAVMAAEQYLV